jgi:hypothetical protein
MPHIIFYYTKFMNLNRHALIRISRWLNNVFEILAFFAFHHWDIQYSIPKYVESILIKIWNEIFIINSNSNG